MHFTPLLVALSALSGSFVGAAPCASESTAAVPPPAASPVAAATTASGVPLVNPALVLGFGANPNPDPDGTGNCNGAVTGSNGQFILVPCDCPPDRNLFIQDLSENVAAGHCINNTVVDLSFPTSSSTADQITRLQAMLDTLQNLRGPGVGCPASSTTWGEQLAQLTGAA